MIAAAVSFDVEAVKADLERDGFAVVPGVLSSDECAVLRAALDRCEAEDIANARGWIYDDGSNQRVWALLNRGEQFIPLATNPLVLDVVGHLLDKPFLLGYLHSNTTGPGGKKQALHVDQSYLLDPVNYAVSLNAVWAVDPFTEENGATRFVRGSHLLAQNPMNDEPEAVRTPAVAPEGSLLFIDGRVWHEAGPNRSTTRRRAIFAYYNRYWVRTGENWTVSLPESVRAAHPELEQLCGFVSYNTMGGVNGPPMEQLPPTESLPACSNDVLMEYVERLGWDIDVPR